ncbi:MAG: hypothetical protein K2W96_27670 [Gemmataceae bacterium]|nr:hypothetical protein [Gemmataceae bacterium]
MDLERRPDNRMEWMLALAAGVFAVLCRVLPYWLPGNGLWHFMPVGALALFAGSRLRTPLALLVPLGAMLVADLLLIAPVARLGYSSFTWGTPVVYASFAIYFGLGWLVRANSANPAWILLAAFAGSVQFFLVTNFASWVVNLDGRYAGDLSGLLASYRDAIPFHQNTLASDLVFTVILFGLHAGLVLSAPKRERVPA